MSKLLVSSEIRDTIDEDQFDEVSQQEKDSHSAITINFSNKDDESTSGLLMKYSIVSVSDDYRYFFKLLVTESMVKDFVSLMGKFTTASIFVDGELILNRDDLMEKTIIEFGIEQELVNPGSIITIAYQ